MCSCQHTCNLEGPLIRTKDIFNGESNMTTHKNDHQVESLQQNEEQRNKLLRFQEENIRLRSVIHDVTEVNKRWQKYNQERQGYVQKLLSTIKELQQKELNAAETNNNNGTEMAALQQNYEHFKMENMILHKELDDSEKNYRHLNAKLDLARHDFTEQLQVLEVQVKLHKDDWEAEKQEKEDALKVSHKLQDEVEVLKKKLLEIQKQVTKLQNTVYLCVCQRMSNDGFSCKMAEAYKRQHTTSSQNDMKILTCQNIPRPPTSNSISMKGRTGEPYVDSALSSFSGSSSSSSSSSSTGSSPSSPPTIQNAPNGYTKYNHNHQQIQPQQYLQQPMQIPQTTRLKYGGLKSREIRSTPRKESWGLVCPKCRRVFPANLELQFTSHVEECKENMHTCSQ